jgi:hypothetical protein
LQTMQKTIGYKSVLQERLEILDELDSSTETMCRLRPIDEVRYREQSVRRDRERELIWALLQVRREREIPSALEERLAKTRTRKKRAEHAGMLLAVIDKALREGEGHKARGVKAELDRFLMECRVEIGRGGVTPGWSTFEDFEWIRKARRYFERLQVEAGQEEALCIRLLYLLSSVVPEEDQRSVVWIVEGDGLYQEFKQWEAAAFGKGEAMRGRKVTVKRKK